MHRARIEWIDTDAAGIYHNSTVVRMVEAAEAELMAAAGIVHEYFPVASRVRYEVSFEAPLFFRQPVTTEVRLVRIGTSSMVFEFDVWGDAHGGHPSFLAAHGSYVTVHIDRAHADGGRSSPWPSSWRSALDALGVRTSDE